MLRLMPRVWQYSAVFVREEDLVPRSPTVAYSQHVSRETYSVSDEACNVSRETSVLPEWFLKGSVPLTESSGFDVEESKVSILP